MMCLDCCSSIRSSKRKAPCYVVTRCSISILVPMPIRRMPPHSSAFRRRRFPIVAPNMLPSSEKRKDTRPMIRTGEMMLFRLSMPKQAKEIPTARASMLVAMANVRIINKCVGDGAGASLFSVKCSYIILPPMKSSNVNAIQWSHASVTPAVHNVSPHPIRGIPPWKSPKKKAIVKNVDHCRRLSEMPLATLTAKQSIAKATANSNVSKNVM